MRSANYAVRSAEHAVGKLHAAAASQDQASSAAGCSPPQRSQFISGALQRSQLLRFKRQLIRADPQYIGGWAIKACGAHKLQQAAELPVQPAEPARGRRHRHRSFTARCC